MNVDLPYTDQERHFIGNFFDDGQRGCMSSRNDVRPAAIINDDHNNDEQHTPYPYSTTYTTCVSPASHSTQPPPPPYIQPGTGGLIKKPTASDVLCGRGGRINSHRGNIRFRDTVSKCKHEYLSKNTTKLIKAHIAASIVTQIRSLCPPGRFLKVDARSGLWVDIGDDKARKKAGQALREDAKEVRKELEEKEVENKLADTTSDNVNADSNSHDTNNNDTVATKSDSDNDKSILAASTSYTSSPTHVAYNDHTSHFGTNSGGAVHLTPPPPPVQYEVFANETNDIAENYPADSLALPGLPYSPINPANTVIYPAPPCNDLNSACDIIGPNYSHATPHGNGNTNISPPPTPPPARDGAGIRRDTSNASSDMNNLILDSFYGMEDDEFSNGSIMLVEEFADYFDDCDGVPNDDSFKMSWLQQDEQEMKLHDSQLAPDMMDYLHSNASNRSITSKLRENNSLCSTTGGEEMSWTTERSNQNMAYWSSQTVASWKELTASWSSKHSGNSFFVRPEEPQRREPSATAAFVDDIDQPKRNIRFEWRQQMLKVKAWRQRKNRMLEQYNNDINVTDESDNDSIKSRDLSPVVVLGRRKLAQKDNNGTPKRSTTNHNKKIFKAKEKHNVKKNKERGATRDPATTDTSTTEPRTVVKRHSFAEKKLRYSNIFNKGDSRQKSLVPPPPPQSIPVQHRQRQNHHRTNSNGNDTASFQSTSNSTVSRLYSDYDFMKSFKTMTSVSSGAMGGGSTRSLISDLSTDMLSLDLGVRKGRKLGAALQPLFFGRKR